MKRTRSMLYTLLVVCSILLLGGCTSSASTTNKHRVSIPVQKIPTIVTSVPTAPSASAQQPTSTPQVMDEPVHLSIPAINVDASIVQVGINDQGDLGTPEQSPWTNVGWYSSGTQPGQRGSAVIDGHLDRPGGDPAVFWLLRNIHSGDLVQITTKSGQKLIFHVTHTALYLPQQAPLQEIFGDGGGSYLNLITCAGDWIPDQHQTTQRMVVYTTLDQA